MMFIRGWSRRAATGLCALFVFILLTGKFGDYPGISKHPNPEPFPVNTDSSESPNNDDRPKHPIDDLIYDARREFHRVLSQQSTTLNDAARRYRERRGRHPPPGFEKWFAAAEKADAVIVEDFFDRIHHDINPLWALEPHDLRAKAHNQPFTVRVRNGTTVADTPEGVPYRVEMWRRLVSEMEPHIPDLDMVVNPMDESRLLVPWETINDYIEQETKNRRIIDVADAISNYSGLADVEDLEEMYDPGWISRQEWFYWDHLKLACPPDSEARNASAMESFLDPIEFPREPVSSYTYKGFVKNFTASQDPCLQPYLRTMHGTFTESLSMSTAHEMIPMFGESKLPQNNEFLIPGAVYLEDDENKYNGGGAKGTKWTKKKDGLFWRGGATGSRNTRENWWHNHRLRFMQMLNSTVISALEAGDPSLAVTFQFFNNGVYDVLSRKAGKLGEWLSSFVDMGFHDLLCFPPEFTHDWWHGDQMSMTCDWLGQWFAVSKQISFDKQFEYKYVPDIDGNSFSGRYRAFLLSSSMPLKSAIYTEWHDDRLFPWVHFAPFDNSYMDIYGVMDYFLSGHDKEAERIAIEGQRWAESVMRREDMRLYVWRLLLEYARVVDDRRDQLAFVGDLLEQ